MENGTHSLATDAPTIDTIHSLLSDRRRRSVVTVLSERDPPIPLRELATALASKESGTGSNEASGETIETVRTALHHCHLPKLDEAGVVDYDTEAKAITSARAAELASLTESTDDVM